MTSRVIERTHPPELADSNGRKNGGIPPHPPDRRGPGSGGEPVARATRTGLSLLLAAVTMLFIAFTATYLSRRTAPDWRPAPFPWIFWATTAVLLASSTVLETARKRGRAGDLEGLRRGLALTTALGVLFLVGQVAGWRQLIALGVVMSSGPHSGFIFLLTGVHGLHLLGGLGALTYALRRVSRSHDGQTPSVEASTVFWHYLGALWIYIFAILFLL